MTQQTTCMSLLGMRRSCVARVITKIITILITGTTDVSTYKVMTIECPLRFPQELSGNCY